MKTNRIATLLIITLIALGATACNNPLLAANAEGASDDMRAEIEARVEAALAEAEASSESEFIAEEEPLTQQVSDETVSEDVAEEPTDPEPTVEPTPEPTVEPSPGPSPTIEVCSDKAAFITDVTVPDGSDFTPGQVFTKTWRLRNAGTCTWTSSYALVFDHGDAMGGPASQALPGLVHPGEIVDLSVELTAPGSEGGYIGYWLLRNTDSVLFGIGADANVAFWVEIEVLEEEDDGEFPVFELAPIPMFPIFVSSGTDQVLLAGACFDLDAGSMVACGSAAADFRYYAEFEMGGFPPVPSLELEIRPLHGARFSLYGNDIPTGGDCQASALSVNTFEIQSKAYCYQTDAGKYGYLDIHGADLMSLTFDWATYSFP